MTKDITKKCAYCQKDFIISAEKQRKALEKGGKTKRRYCLNCLKRWRRGEILL